MQQRAMDILSTRTDIAAARLDAEIADRMEQSDEQTARRAAAEREVRRHQAELSRLQGSGTEVEEWKDSLRQLRHWQPFIKAQIILGIVMMGAGFWFWYTRVQRYEDRLLKARAELEQTSDDRNEGHHG